MWHVQLGTWNACKQYDDVITLRYPSSCDITHPCVTCATWHTECVQTMWWCDNVTWLTHSWHNPSMCDMCNVAQSLCKRHDDVTTWCDVLAHDMTRDRHNGAHAMRANNVRPAASLVCAPLRSILGTSWRQPLPPQSSWCRSRHTGLSHMNEPWMCHAWDMSWMSHGTYEWVMVHMNASWHIWMSNGYVMNEICLEWHASCRTWRSHIIYGWFLVHMNKSCHIWKCHVT